MDRGDNRVNIDALLRLFTCPGCGNPANKPPLFQCVKGHVACSQCSAKCRGSCPTCRQRMTTERNFWMEEASTCITFPLQTERNSSFVLGASLIELSSRYSDMEDEARNKDEAVARITTVKWKTFTTRQQQRLMLLLRRFKYYKNISKTFETVQIEEKGDPFEIDNFPDPFGPHLGTRSFAFRLLHVQSSEDLVAKEIERIANRWHRSNFF